MRFSSATVLTAHVRNVKVYYYFSPLNYNSTPKLIITRTVADIPAQEGGDNGCYWRIKSTCRIVCSIYNPISLACSPSHQKRHGKVLFYRGTPSGPLVMRPGDCTSISAVTRTFFRCPAPSLLAASSKMLESYECVSSWMALVAVARAIGFLSGTLLCIREVTP